MPALDTNVLARCIVQDNPSQLAAAKRLISGCAAEGSTLFVPVTVVLELEWVLRSSFAFGKLTHADARPAMSHCNLPSASNDPYWPSTDALRMTTGEQGVQSQRVMTLWWRPGLQTQAGEDPPMTGCSGISAFIFSALPPADQSCQPDLTDNPL